MYVITKMRIIFLFLILSSLTFAREKTNLSFDRGRAKLDFSTIKAHLPPSKLLEITDRIKKARKESIKDFIELSGDCELQTGSILNDQFISFRKSVGNERVCLSYYYKPYLVIHEDPKTGDAYRVEFYRNGNVRKYDEIGYLYREKTPETKKKLEKLRKLYSSDEYLKILDSIERMFAPNGVELYFMEDGRISAFRNFVIKDNAQYRVGKHLAWNIKGEKTFDKDYETPVKIGFKTQRNSPPEKKEK